MITTVGIKLEQKGMKAEQGRHYPYAAVTVLYTALAGRLIQARQAAGFETAHTAAIRLAMHSETYIVHEQGRAAVKPAELRRYAEVFGVSHGWLSTGVGAGPKIKAR